MEASQAQIKAKFSTPQACRRLPSATSPRKDEPAATQGDRRGAGRLAGIPITAEDGQEGRRGGDGRGTTLIHHRHPGSGRHRTSHRVRRVRRGARGHRRCPARLGRGRHRPPGPVSNGTPAATTAVTRKPSSPGCTRNSSSCGKPVGTVAAQHVLAPIRTALLRAGGRTAHVLPSHHQRGAALRVCGTSVPVQPADAVPGGRPPLGHRPGPSACPRPAGWSGWDSNPRPADDESVARILSM